MPTRQALCVGINAYPRGAELGGCVNDALDWAGFLIQRGYEVTTLLDSVATGDAILAELNELCESGGWGSRVVFTFSGHGTYYTDLSGDEPDRRDEAICPVDVFTRGSILDDDLARIFATRPAGTRALMVSDSCHSGSVERFLGGYVDGTPRFLPPALVDQPPRDVDTRRAVAHAQSVALLAGCADDEVAYDATIAGRPCGAFTNAAMVALRAESNPTLAAAHKRIRNMLPSDRWPQTPQLRASAWQRRWRIG